MNNNYKFIFICIIIAYSIAQILLATIERNPTIIRYFSILQIVFFVIPILYFIEEKYRIFQNNYETVVTGKLESEQNYWDTVKENLKINFNFKPEIIVYLLWGIVGLNLLNMGAMSIIESVIPSELKKIYNSVMRDTMMAQISLTKNYSKTIFEFLQITFFIAIIPAICEEILFRGYLMQNILVRNSPRIAIIFSALIFSIIHFNICGFLPIFFIGLYLGMLVYITNSIIPAMLLHFLNNFLVIISVNFGTSINYQQSTPIWLAFLLLILGGALILLTYSKLIEICKTTSNKLVKL